MRNRRVLSRFCLGLIGLLAVACPAARGGETPPGARRVDFNRDIHPILSENCFACHGPDKGQRKADLRLDTRDGIRASHDDIHMIVPGDAGDSEIFRRVSSDDDEERMPPLKSKKKLSAEQIALIRRWIEEGAEWKGHWSYLKPERLEVPAADRAGCPHNPIDGFVLARLKPAGLRPSPEADRIALIRRLSFDLTGLPPSMAEVDAFLDDRGPDAYERLVDRLLASPHYGERMAVSWADLVRFADSIGYHSDNPMSVSPYRDYLIKSFNENKRFDRFTVEQLAGDLLPHATIEQRVASTYNRLLMTTEEGGAQPKEYEAKYAADRVRNVSSVWLGATMGCCQCHDHKFDPYSTRDFYQFAAFFADVEEKSVGRREPGMPVPDERQAGELARFDEQIDDIQRSLEAPRPELEAAQADWERTQSPAADWQLLDPQNYAASSGTTLEKLPDGSLRASGAIPAKETYTVHARTELHGLTAIRLEVLTDPALPEKGPGTAENGNFILSELRVTASTGTQPATPVKLQGALADFAQDGHAVAASIDGKAETGWAVGPQAGRPHTAIFRFVEPVGGDGGAVLTFTLEQQAKSAKHNLGRFRLSVTTSPDPTDGLDFPPNIRSILAIAPESREPDQRRDLAAYYRSIAPSLQPIRDQLAAVNARKKELLDALPKALITVSGPPRVVRVLPRGNWLDESGEVVTPAVPHFLPQIPTEDDRPTRLELARWIVSRENPLTARVAVNRLWKLFFGQGLSRSLEDLGSQGEWPTHPELLDWLAIEFVDSGWDVKHIVRLLVTSGCYRQTSAVSPEHKERDPYNRLLARQSRFRLDAEMVRDNALAISGLLSARVGGPSVKPYQPPGYWDQLNFPTRTYESDRGENQYRRGLYTHWQRTFLHPSLQAFDAPTHEECTVERTRSNIPQQALVLLDDPTYVEAARALAERILREGGTRARERLVWAYRCCLSRKPEADELWVLAELLEKHGRQFARDVEAAKKLVSIGQLPVPKDLDTSELAAWTSVARVLLNLHETITRD